MCVAFFVFQSKFFSEFLFLSSFSDAFKNIRQRVLWKFNGTTDLPNVMTRKWFPQNDVLAHPNVVLFISQGGTFSNYEAVANGVPMIIIPFNHNHHRNAKRAHAAGYAHYIPYATLTIDNLNHALRHMLITQPEPYAKRAKELKTIMDDNLVPPMDEAIYWIEYVCEFNGAPHLKTHARHMTWFTYLLVDVFLVNFIGFAMFLLILYISCAPCCKRRNRQQTGYNPNDPHKKNK